MVSAVHIEYHSHRKCIVKLETVKLLVHSLNRNAIGHMFIQLFHDCFDCDSNLPKLVAQAVHGSPVVSLGNHVRGPKSPGG